MSGRNIIPLDQSRRVVRRAFLEQGIIAMLIFLIYDAMIISGMIGTFMLMRTAEDIAWPPTGQPWFPPVETAINTAVLLVSGVLVYLAARVWKKQESRVGPLLLAAMALGTFFVLFQGFTWAGLIRQGLNLRSNQLGNLFCLIVATHAVHVLGAVLFMGVAGRRLEPLSDYGDETRGSPSSSSFTAARFLWYFTVGIWPILYLCLYR
jgi:cytochrome c oxidase subunit 3